MDTQSPKMVRFLIEKGMARDEKQANTILISIALVSFALAVFILFKTFMQPTYNVEISNMDMRVQEQPTVPSTTGNPRMLR